ncbi:TPA: MerR family transcriptional regulator [Campylobacter jejuni]|nr:MerR family transcriptional regulator [Campylobacter jejuni]HDZ5017614.1 MerR family transcriptional regulator [Campylobacter jejuni]HDZ5042795.1 MerR family transcriptional regulator [Campylobacter jejuni]HDZ5066172.1 MerR family transcriptional regulator [Campylobacter jejuni]HDZ5084563.1 MerR family transcriptional regulator [Campylobacter jejuni]
MAYTIKEVEKETKISAHTLRFWAKKGLFPFVQKDENSVKYFSKSDVEWAKWIEWLRISGMSIEQIRHYIKLCSLGIKTAKERQDMLKQAKEKLQNQIKTLKESEKILAKKIKIYDDMLKEQIDGFNPESKDYQSCDKLHKLKN